MEKVTYEIIGYKTKVDYDNINGEILDEGIMSKNISFILSKDHLKTKKYQIIKLQSSDREYIEIFELKVLQGIRKPFYEFSDDVEVLKDLKIINDPILKNKISRLDILKYEIMDYLNENYLWD